MTLDEPATTRPTFTPGIPGTYLFRLTVKDSDMQAAESLTAVYVTAPPLNLQARSLSDGRIEIAWSGSAGGYAIDTRNALDNVSGWEPWSGAPPEQRGGQWVRTVAASDQVKFFRLRSTRLCPHCPTHTAARRASAMIPGLSLFEKAR